MQQENKNYGLPEIAQVVGQKRSLVYLCFITALAVLGGTYWYHQTNHTEIKPVEETYTVATDTQVDTKKATQEEHKSIQTTQANSIITSPPVTEEALQQQMALMQEKQKALQQR
ncbi:MAG: hypothetical protein JO149_01690, partial [Gammaproteobacteria bacterium]|nr:hypothetical protein [Gammaproteobacteria bacterium]